VIKFACMMKLFSVFSLPVTLVHEKPAMNQGLAEADLKNKVAY